jgi:hypothetical protein
LVANIWSIVQSRLRPGISIPNWTADKGFLGDEFSVTAVGENHVDVDSPSALNSQRIPRNHLETVNELWMDYVRGTVKRKEIRDKTRFSKYIISLLHWIGEQNNV